VRWTPEGASRVLQKRVYQGLAAGEEISAVTWFRR